MEKEKVLEELAKIVDPEIGFNIVDLGFIEDLKIEGKNITITLVLTSPFCPFTNYLMNEIREKLKEMGFEEVTIQISDKPWTVERLSEKAKKALGF